MTSHDFKEADFVNVVNFFGRGVDIAIEAKKKTNAFPLRFLIYVFENAVSSSSSLNRYVLCCSNFKYKYIAKVKSNN